MEDVGNFSESEFGQFGFLTSGKVRFTEMRSEAKKTSWFIGWTPQTKTDKMLVTNLSFSVIKIDAHLPVINFNKEFVLICYIKGVINEKKLAQE